MSLCLSFLACDARDRGALDRHRNNPAMLFTSTARHSTRKRGSGAVVHDWSETKGGA